VQPDLRDTELYREVEGWYRAALGTSFGSVSDATDLRPSPDGKRLAFTGSRFDRLDQKAVTRVCLLDLSTGVVEQLTHGPNNDHSPRWSPTGDQLAFLSDRDQAGIAQPFVLPVDQPGAERLVVRLEGAAEALEWSPEGASIMLAVAPRGADLAGASGSGFIAEDASGPSWLPSTENGPDDERLWRSLCIVDVGTSVARRPGPPGLNIWEATWCGADAIAAIASDIPGEDGWYTTRLVLLDLRSGAVRTLYHAPRYGSIQQQLAMPAASPSGAHVGVIQGISSDRGVVAGDLQLVVADTGAVVAVDTRQVDVAHLAWRDEQTLVFAGLRELESVVGEVHAPTGQVTELWAGADFLGASGWFPAAVPAGDGAAYFTRESRQTPPAIVRLRDGSTTTIHTFEDEGTKFVASHTGRTETITWASADGVEVQGFLALPDGPGPHPLVVAVHGGPVGAWVNCWPMRMRGFQVLTSYGYAVLYANPRGSVGWGQPFVAPVIGDPGGADAKDLLSGIEMLVKSGHADPARIGVAGASYGGFMSAWLITQDRRFAAAVILAPITDWHSFQDTTNIPYFKEMFLDEAPPTRESGHLQLERSPVWQVDNVRTPALTLVGALDRCTPPTQGVQFHRALLRQGNVPSVLVNYPTLGHGPRGFPELIDYTTRLVAWFTEHMPARMPPSP
jgi:dipeptidyl aminopeptidase/acylaminoacyl peptidase